MSTQSSEACVALVGHPNTGKTTLFNALTGQNQKIGNYTGVTVEKRSGDFFTPHGKKIELVDLPGCYSLIPNSPDEAVTRDALLGDLSEEETPDLVLCVLDAANLERHLYLLQQVLDLGCPVLAVLNKVDLAEQMGLRIDPAQLSKDFDIPFIAISGNKQRGVTQLKQAIRFPLPQAPGRCWQGSPEIEKTLKHLEKTLAEQNIPRPAAHAIQALSDPTYEVGNLTAPTGLDEQISKQRFEIIQAAIDNGVRRPDQSPLSLTDKLDHWLLHPFWGWAFFSVLMFTVFWSIFRFAETPMGWIESLQTATQNWIGSFMSEGDFKSLIIDGIIAGVGGVLVFLPQIILLFFFISLLESSGYMARAAYLMDGIMNKVGLSGKSFLPLLSGYACAIPGIMATRTIPNAKERLATILILPWTSCTARLPVYVLIIPLMVTGTFAQGAALFGIYALGTITALLTAKILKPRLGAAEAPQFILELPPYHRPQISYILKQVWERASAFLKKAGTVILGLSIILWFLDTYPKSDSDDPVVQQAASFNGKIGKAIEPIVAPLGWDSRMGTAMIASFAAREVFRSSLAISYATDEEEEETLRAQLTASTRKDGSMLYTPLVGLSIIIFFIYALQCLPTTAVVRRETDSWKWALAQLGGMTLFAYLAALIVYQTGLLLGFT